MREGYKALFQTFPDADRKDAEALTNFFKAKTDNGEATIKMMVGTFKALAQFGDFKSAADIGAVGQSDSAPEQQASMGHTHAVVKTASSSGVSVNLNIELALPADETGKVYEAFFKAMKKHLLNDE